MSMTLKIVVVAPIPKRQSHDGNGSEAGTLRKHPQTVANILPNTGHRHTSRVWVKTYSSPSDLMQDFSTKTSPTDDATNHGNNI